MEEAIKSFDFSLFFSEVWERLTLVVTSLGLYEWGMLAVIIVLAVSSSYLLRKMRPKIIVAFEGPTGKTVITQSAAADLVRRACESISEIGKVSSTLNDSKRLLVIDIRFKMHIGCKLDAVSRELNEKVEGSIRETLNVTKKIKINPRLQGFIGTPASHSTSHVTHTSEMTAPMMSSGSENKIGRLSEDDEDEDIKRKQPMLDDDDDWGLDMGLRDDDDDASDKKNR